MPADCSQRGGTLAAANTIVLRTRQTRAVVLVTIIRNIFSLPAPYQSKILISTPPDSQASDVLTVYLFF